MVSLNLRERLGKWRTGAITGLSMTENNLKMTGALISPFIGMWLFIKMFLPDSDIPEKYNQYVSIAFFIWLVWCVALWAYAKADAQNYIVFPQSKWKFPDGSCRTFDLKLPQDSWEKKVTFADGSIGYKLYDLGSKIWYDDPDLAFPRIFSKAYWTLPSVWEDSFQRRAYGEFYHKGLYVTKPDCEDISVYVIGWEETVEGETIPVCLINDCAFTYMRALENAQLPIDLGKGMNMKALYVLYADGRRQLAKNLQHSAYLEERVEVAEKDSSENWKKASDKRLESVRGRHGRIMDVTQKWTTRLLNAKNLAIALLVITAIFLMGRLIFGLW